MQRIKYGPVFHMWQQFALASKPKTLETMLLSITALKMKFAIKDFFNKCHPNPQKTADFFKCTEEFPNEKLYFLQ